MKRILDPRGNKTDRQRSAGSILRLSEVLLTKAESETFYAEALACLLDCIPGAAAGLLYRYDPQKEGLDVVAAVGYDSSSIQTNIRVSGEGIAGAVFQTGQPEIRRTGASLQKEESDPSSLVSVGSNSTEVNDSATFFTIAAPVGVGTSRLGVVALESRNGQDSFRSRDLARLAQLTRLIAFAIIDRDRAFGTKSGDKPPKEEGVQTERISILAHEMRTPLTSIKGYSTALLMEEATFTPEVQREFLKSIDEQCDVLQELIHDLLESATIEAGALRLELEPVHIADLAQQVADEFSLRGDTHRFVIDFPADLPLVQADRGRVLQVLRNLMDNAVKYSLNGKLIVVRGEARQNHIVVSVSDQGIGIAPEHLNRLFEKYFRVKSGAARNVIGSGLGLPIARNIVEVHGGQIWAESRPDEGSTFHFTLPLKQAPKDESNG